MVILRVLSLQQSNLYSPTTKLIEHSMLWEKVCLYLNYISIIRI